MTSIENFMEAMVGVVRRNGVVRGKTWKPTKIGQQVNEVCLEIEGLDSSK